MLDRYSEIFNIDVTQIKDHEVLFDYSESVIKESLERLRDTLIPIVPKFLRIDIKNCFSDQGDLKYNINIVLNSCQRTYAIEDTLFALKNKLKSALFVDNKVGLFIEVDNVKYNLYKHHQEELGDNFMFT